MLSHLSVRDFAIVEALELELGPGMTVLTGETGAGKSILLDALGLVLGDRAATGLVRAGAERAEVVAVFDLARGSDAAAFLAGHELDADEGECIVRRTVSAEGRSRAYVNARAVPAQTLRALGELLVDIHGQHAHQSLTRAADQRALLDRYAGNESLLERTRDVHRAWQALETECADLGESSADREAREDYLRFQIEELGAQLEAAGDLDALGDEHRRLAHAEQLLATVARVIDSLDGEHGASASGLLGGAVRELGEALGNDPALGPAHELLESALIQLDEAAGELARYRDGLEISPARLAELETRIDALEGLARKHRVRPAELAGVLETLSTDLERSERSAERLAALEAERDAVLARYEACDAALGKARRAAAGRLGDAVMDKLASLGMPGARLEVEVGAGESPEPRAHGSHQIRLRVSANPGQAPQPLAQVASGGELSRLSLAIQVVGNGDRGIPTLVFDEVDAGVGGRIAEMVGRELAGLGAARQVLCVTHLPQVACQAHRHVQVLKRSAGASTWTSVQPLDAEARVMELARMLGGEAITDRTVAHARELLSRE